MHVPISNYLKSNTIRNNVISELRNCDVNNGLIDSVKYLLDDYNYDNRVLLSHLLQSYWVRLSQFCVFIVILFFFMSCTIIG